MSDRRRILLAMITVGQGHKAAADALASHLERLEPGRHEVEIMDFTAAVGDLAFDERHKASWDAMLTYPWTAYWGQRVLDRVVPLPLTRWAASAMLADHARHAAPFVLARRPDLVVTTHFFTLRALAMARQRHGLDVPLVGVNPDPFDSHALWAEPSVDEMIVFSDRAKRDLVTRRVPSERVSVFPYVVRPDFPHAAEPSDVRAALGLDPHRFTVLHSAGGQGIGGKVEASVDAVLARDLDLQYVVVCGRNEGLRERIAQRAAAHCGRTRVVPVGFVSDMPRYVRAADVVVGKAGPASTFEALLSGRPMLYTSFAAANEKAVLDYCVGHGVGAFVPRPSDLADRVASLARDPASLGPWRARIRALGLVNGGPAVAGHLSERYLAGPRVGGNGTP